MRAAGDELVVSLHARQHRIIHVPLAIFYHGGAAPKPPEFLALGQWANGLHLKLKCHGSEFTLPRHRGITPLAPPAAPVALRQSRILRTTYNSQRELA
ncbi:hypothetical protein QT970_27860 [Microcoleus sp. herbarium8]|uniref:hypothetical protein n=1 Tax=Microcoleus sp. herbarium8 TaxID=3055436 RepID=UPI002FD1D65A